MMTRSTSGVGSRRNEFVWLFLCLFCLGASGATRARSGGLDTDKDGLPDGMELGLAESQFNSDLRVMPFQKRRLILSDGSFWPPDEATNGEGNIDIKGTDPMPGVQRWDSDPATRTDPANPDTDGDGFWDGPNRWARSEAGGLTLHIGEDKNADGKFAPLGEDGLPGTEDDETDPRSPSSLPEGPGAFLDSDADGLLDVLEEEIGCDPNHPDSDSDGLRDGDEYNLYLTSPTRPDSDNDGLPDGYELGATVTDPALEPEEPGKNKYNQAWYARIDRGRGYPYRLKTDTQTYKEFSFKSMPTRRRSDPLSYDTDFDHISDVVEELNGSDPSRGLIRLPDEPPPNIKFAGQLEPELGWRGLAPIYRSGADAYSVYANWVVDDEGAGRWEAELPLSLGADPNRSITLSASPAGSAKFSVNGGPFQANSVEVTAADLVPNARMKSARVRMQTTSAELPSEVTLNLGPEPGGGPDVLRNYAVVKNWGSYDEAGEIAPWGPGGAAASFSFAGGGAKSLDDDAVGVGYHEAEGELFSNQAWTNDDWWSVGIELATSGGNFSFDLGQLGAKYTLHLFLSTAIAPIEYWLKFVLHWRDSTRLRAPEEFRSLAGMMLDKNVDMGWIAALCDDITEREGWDAIYPQPWAFEFDDVSLREFDGALLYDQPVVRLPGGMGVAAPAGGPQLKSAGDGLPIGAEWASMRGTKSQLFESAVNQAVAFGGLKKRGIPAGRLIDLAYGDAGGLRYGPDGVVLHPDGKFTLIESKFVTRGRMGTIKCVDLHGNRIDVIQGSPQWFKKAIYEIARRDPERFNHLLTEVAGTNLEEVMKGVRHIADNIEAIVDEATSNIPDLTEAMTKRTRHLIENFGDPELTGKIWRNAGESVNLDKIGRCFAEDFNFALITKKGRALRHFNRIGDTLTATMKALGKSVPNGFDIAERVVKEKIK